ncbi:MAG: glycosyltransferase [Epulopiscium sp.]|nr:glycosyltransferase [Candidatus Epulonipiscium sp.]
MVDVSIIVPIYNVASVLNRCINSLIGQSLRNIEIILVNDGSTDESLKICQSYSKIDSRVKVVNKVNGGVSSARNAGLRIATGKYVGFVDADDWVESNMYEMMLKSLENKDASICMCEYFVDNAGKSNRIRLPCNEVLSKQSDVAVKLVGSMLSDITHNRTSNTIMGTVCRLLIPRSFIEEHQLKFREDIYYKEDLLFCVQTFLKAKKIAIVNEALYYYVSRDGSAVRQYREDLDWQIDKVYVGIKESLDENGVLHKMERHLNLQFVNDRLELIANECHPDNVKGVSEKLTAIKKHCKNEHLKMILPGLIIRNQAFHKKLLLLFLEKEFHFLLFFYYRLFNILIKR